MAGGESKEISWQAPPFEADDPKKLAFCKRCIESGIKWNEDQMSSTDIKRGIDILAGKSGSAMSGKWANITTGDLKRAVNEIVETLSDIRPFWGYETNNEAFKEEANMMNKVTKSVYLESFVDRSLHDALQFAAVTSAGFLYPFYSRSKFGSGDGEFVFMPLGQPDVLPVQLPRSRDYQKAYVVTLAVPFGVAEAHARFPLFQWALKPFAQKRYAKTPGGEQRRGYDQNRWRMHSIETQLEQFCDIYFTYILDLRINYGEMDKEGKPILVDGNPIGKELSMGQEGTSWFYKVPYVGQTITRFEGRREVTRPADVEDCRVYPYRRLMISCDQALMYDGPGFDMHGMVPLIPFYFDKWAWGEAFSLFRGTAPIQDAIDDLVRSVYRIAMSRANPGKSYNTDITSGEKGAKISSRQAEQIDPFDPNMTFGVDGDVKEPVMRPPMPEWCYNVPDWVIKVVEVLQHCIAKQLGLDQIQSLQKLKTNVEDPEKLLEAEGPVVTGTSRSMEMGLRDLGEIQKWNIIQYLPVGTIMNYTGAMGIAPQVFDYSPEMLIPSHLPGEETINGADGSAVPSKSDPMTRARYFAQNLKFFITPHSLHYIAQKQFKLNLLAAKKEGLPIDPEMMANSFDIPNWGTIEGSTVKERVFNWAKEQLKEKADLMKLEKALGLGPPPDEQGPGQGQGGGRPMTHKKPVKVKQKGAASGGRVVKSTSG